MQKFKCLDQIKSKRQELIGTLVDKYGAEVAQKVVDGSDSIVNDYLTDLAKIKVADGEKSEEFYKVAIMLYSVGSLLVTTLSVEHEEFRALE